MFDRFRNNRRGMIGYLASLASLNTKRIDIKSPNTIRQTTCGEFQGKVIPPKSRPRRNITAKPTTDRLPNQSIAMIPAMKPVPGLWRSRKKNTTRKVRPELGRLIHQIHLQETNCVKAPPRIGPTPLANAHVTFRTPSQKPRSLRRINQRSAAPDGTLYLMLKRSLIQMLTKTTNPPDADP